MVLYGGISMAMTLAEKILAKASGNTQVSPGDIVMAKVETAMVHDITGPLSVNTLKKEGIEKVWDNEKIVIPFDHQIPADSINAAENHILIRITSYNVCYTKLLR